MVSIVAYLMISHWAVLPHPRVGDAQFSERLQAAELGRTPNWSAVHFLYDDCPCSRRVLQHVIDSQPIPGVTERVVLISKECLRAELGRGDLQVEYVTPENLKQRYGVESAPLLVVMDTNQSVRYSGGYTSRKQGPKMMDREIIAQLVAGQSAMELPLYGCAVSTQLQRAIDPLGFKY